MTDLASLLAAFKAASGCEAIVWSEAEGRPTRRAATSRARTPRRLPAEAEGAIEIATNGGRALLAAIPGPGRTWLQVGPARGRAPLEPQLAFLLPVVAQVTQSALEVEHAAGELAERYEEINLLYTISEILGRTVDLGVATSRILAEISDTVGARRGAVHVYDAGKRSLIAVAALGVAVDRVPPIAAGDEGSVTAQVFRDGHAAIVLTGEMPSAAEQPYRSGAMLSVPILWTSPKSVPEPLGVVSLSDRRGGHPFTAGDQKLLSAIASQIAAAIQNARLVSESVNQQRLQQEMQLAHDLQMRLLPDPATMSPNAAVGARVMPAESVGGDLYNLLRLGPGRTGVLVGDVSGHGYQAALIMALAMSASTIHAQATTDPGEMLGALAGSLREELGRSEMFVSMFYGVVDRTGGRLRYANAGHPHAFVISRRGTSERLPALDPPLGMGSAAPMSRARSWDSDDTLVVFTDGVSDARDAAGTRLREERVLEVARRHCDDSPGALVERLFAVVTQHTAGAAPRDDLTIVVLRS